KIADNLVLSSQPSAWGRTDCGTVRRPQCLNSCTNMAHSLGHMMQNAPQQDMQALPADPGALVDAYLTTLMKPDPEGARRYVSPELRIRFTGGRAMRDPSECTAFNKSRY